MKQESQDITSIIQQMIKSEVESHILELKEQMKKVILIENKPILTIDDFVELTGLKKPTIYKYCSEGKIGYYRPTAKQTFFTWENISDFILNEKYYSPAKSEIKRKVESKFMNDKNFNNKHRN